MKPDNPRTAWRLLLMPAPSRGAWNMAVDEAIFECMENGSTLPTMRLYAWEPACLSLGHLQPIADADLEELSCAGWDIVRRPTGGRAILHANEITYSVIGPRSDARLSGRVLDSYQSMARGLLKALELLSLDVEMNQAQGVKGRPSSPVCFEVPSIYEITIGGRKIIGSAQARRRNVLLQHGSLPLGGDLKDITRALVFPDDAARKEAGEHLESHSITLERVLGHEISWNEAARALMSGFEKALNLVLIPGSLSPQELSAARRLYEEKYNHPDWTHRY